MFAGVHQGDWHADQIICPPSSDGGRDIVLIDFAFALQDLGDDGTPCRTGTAELRYLVLDGLNIDPEILDRSWFPYVEEEW